MKPASLAPRERMAALAAPLLGFLAGDGERFERFLALTGFSVDGLRAAADGDHFAQSLFSYLGSDEQLVVAFAQERGLAPEEIGALAAAATDPPLDG